MSVCRIRWCEDPVHARGFCRNHYNRYHRYGNPYESTSRQRFCDICGVGIFIENYTYPGRGDIEDDGYLKKDRWLHWGASNRCYSSDDPEVATYKGSITTGTVSEKQYGKPHVGDLRPKPPIPKPAPYPEGIYGMYGIYGV